MAIQTNIPPDLTDIERALIFQILDAELNAKILYALLHGIYTGIIAVILWTIFTSRSQPVRQVMAIVLTLLYIVTTINFAFGWLYIHLIFVNNGQSLWTKYLSYSDSSGALMTVGSGATAAVCTILADSTIIWRCWTIWGRWWPIILLPVLFLVSGIVCKIIVIIKVCGPSNEYVIGTILYPSFIVATTSWCTLLIIYRIVTVARAGSDVGGGLRTYRHVIELLVESSTSYSIFFILYVVFYTRNDVTSYYFDVLCAIARGIAPTLLIGRIAAGHARPDDSWQGSMVSGSLHFRSRSRGQNSQQDSSMDDIGIENGIREDDPIAQPEDGHCDNKEVDNHGDDLEDTRPEDDPNAIIV
ncbi:hypothetical protein ARMSODRAFT_1078534 [Armillaria solidipes]|uniref:Family A G protein-coupled receptor-like protein n=1 Tax=Armillaria solidipes TaxID=1076256 RepID=A0A2H3BZX4_9AGAR|nr:hypothetical protein ARMSODRAFT_1078534 [Armillaria solidipes]